MKKFLGSLLTTLFIGSTVTPVISCATGNDKKPEPVKKQEITETNLNEFFKVHNTFEYKGKFFFKEATAQIKDEPFKVKWQGFLIFQYLIGQVFNEEFNEIFNYIPSEYSLSLPKIARYEGFELNKNYSISFNIKIYSITNNIDYTSKNLTLNFMETEQYSKQEWMGKYLEFLIGYGNSIWGDKYEDYTGYFPYEPSATYKTKEEKEQYSLNNIKSVLDHISNNYTEILSSDLGTSIWFYEDKRIDLLQYLLDYSKLLL